MLINSGNDIIKATPTHPFCDINLGWVQAKDLTLQSQLLDKENHIFSPNNIEVILEQVPVYNFEVASHHNYFVGLIGWLMHNQCWKPNDKERKLWRKGKVKSHFEKYGTEFGAENATEYTEMALEFATRKSEGIIEEIYGPYIYRYEPSTNKVFVGTISNGGIKAFYVWDGRSDDLVIQVLRDRGRIK